MRKLAAIFCFVFFVIATLSVADDGKQPDGLKTQPIKSLAGKKLLVGWPAKWQTDKTYKSGATRIDIHYATGNIENWPRYFVIEVELEAPVQQEQIEFWHAFRKKCPSEMHSAIVMEVLACDLTDREHPQVKVRLLGAANYPAEGKNFADADLKDQQYLPFAVTKQEARDQK
jgi:hypothetical protein